MLEAVNSTLSNASLIRGAAEQTSSTRSLAANPSKIQEVAQAPYLSQYIHLDIDFDTAVIQIRNPDTGDVVRQIPSEPALEAARRQIAAQAVGLDTSDRVAPTPQQSGQSTLNPTVQQIAQPTPEAPAPQQAAATPAASTASFGAFAKAIATSVGGGSGVGGTVSTFA